MPNPYPRQHSNTWWLKRRPYTVFMAREWSSVFLSGYVVSLLVLLTKIAAGNRAYEDYVDFLQSPPMVVFHVVALLFSVLHSVTWFAAVPKGMPLRRGEDLVPPVLMIGANYVAWVVVSAVAAALFVLD